VTPAEYWHDPLDEQTYRADSVFLADINNERVNNNIILLFKFFSLKNNLLVRVSMNITKIICNSWKIL